MAELRIARRAQYDIIRIYSYIAADSSKRAQSFDDRLRDKLMLLAQSPTLGRPRQEFGRNTRSFAVRPIVVFYEFDEDLDIVYILRIVDGRRDLGTVFLEGH